MPLQDEIDRLAPWYHFIDFGNGVTTRRKSDTMQFETNIEKRWQKLKKYLPSDLAGQTVLDLGCNSGYISVKCKADLNADRVVAVDYEPRNIAQAHFLRKYFKVDFETYLNDLHLYALTTADRFDYVIFSRIFYHLKYPNLVLDRLAAMTRKMLIMTTPVIPSRDNKTEDYNSLDEILGSDVPKMIFIEKKYHGDPSNWWIPNEACVLALARSAGFELVHHIQKDEIFVFHPADPIGGIKLLNSRLHFPDYRIFSTKENEAIPISERLDRAAEYNDQDD